MYGKRTVGRARKTLTPRFTDFFTDFEKKKNRLFCSLRNFLPPLRETYVAAYSSRFSFFSVLFLILSQETYIGLLFIEKEEYKSLFVTLTTSTGTENNLTSPIAGFQCHAIPIRSK